VADAQMFVMERAKTLLQDWRAAKSYQQQPLRMPNIIDNSKWKKPAEGRYKCNIDASFSRHLNKVGIGICLRDDLGAFVLAKTDWISLLCEVHIGEALGLLSALEWVHELNLGPIDFELDAKKVVDNFLSTKHDGTEFGDIIQSCRSLFRNFYENSKVEFVRRQANEAAHALAKEATLSASSQVLYEIPYCIEHILINDML
jgi:ribonuclease HI